MKTDNLERLQATGKLFGIDVLGSLEKRIEKASKRNRRKGIYYAISTKERYPGTGRNSPCPCGSGIKYKKCCLNSEVTV